LPTSPTRTPGDPPAPSSTSVWGPARSSRLPPGDTRKSALRRVAAATLRFLLGVLLLGWASLALWYNAPWPALAAAFLVLGGWAWWTRRWLVFGAAFLAVLAWFIALKPSHDRPWRAEVALMPRAFIEGDRVRLTGVRDFQYRSRNEFTVRYEEREVSLAHLTGVDFYLSYWTLGPVGHTFVSFLFDDAPPLSISIETRPEIGEGFDPLASLFKQFELIYVVGSEPDVVGVRTNHRKEEVFLYRTIASPDDARRLLTIYLERINQLAEEPEFYHLLSNSCTINIVQYVRAMSTTPIRFNIRHFLNGWFDAYLHSVGKLASSLPFEELRARSQINEAAQAAGDGPDFSRRIRASLPTMQATP
jgi:Domain of unknown function (DUF4105)